MTVYHITGLPVDIGTLEDALAGSVVVFEDPLLSVPICKLRSVSIFRHHICIQNRQFQVGSPIRYLTHYNPRHARNPFVLWTATSHRAGAQESAGRRPRK